MLGRPVPLGSTASQMPSVVLRFQQSGINRVLFLDNATIAILFTIQAGTQGYAPKYGLNTSANPALLQQNAPASGLRGAVGVGWQPAQDVYEAARTRRSIRAYKPDTVPLETVREILELGRHAPSGSLRR